MRRKIEYDRLGSNAVGSSFRPRSAVSIEHAVSWLHSCFRIPVLDPSWDVSFSFLRLPLVSCACRFYSLLSARFHVHLSLVRNQSSTKNPNAKSTRYSKWLLPPRS